MLTISKPLSSGQAQSYHREEFANAQDNYYTEGDRVRGQWHGQLAQKWGLQGEVDAEQFGRLADGQHPLTGEQLVRFRLSHQHTNAQGEKIKTMEHRAGWDATFAAPKSVSLSALVGGDERVRQAHREAVDVTLNELETFVQARIGGNRPAETTGQWVAAKFEHDSSRPVDGYAAPQLHTHVVFFNMTERGNGEIRAMQPHELYRSQQYGAAIYRAELSLRLKQLGYEIEPSAKGAPEIKGYSQDYLNASSPRRQQIREELQRQGFGNAESAEAAEIAQRQTRAAKLNITHEEMQQRHQEMAAEYGHQAARVIEAAQARAQEIDNASEEQKQRHIQQALHYARERNLERDAATDERHIMRDALKRSMGKASLVEVRRQFQREVRERGFIELEPQPGAAGRVFTTQKMMDLERDNIRIMREGQNQHAALVSFQTRRQIENDYSHLSAGQHGAVEEVLSSRDQVQALDGVAGAGKTTSLTAIRDAAEREGYQVEGFAPTSRAAQNLQEAGIQSSTLQRHLARPGHEEDGQKRFYVLDESSLASTRQVNEFLHKLDKNDRVLLVGDVRQHEAVEAGRPYSQLQEAGMQTAHLDEIVRQKDPALKQVVEQLAQGESRSAIFNLERQGRVHQIEDREERLTTIAQEYGRRPDSTLVISPDNESRRQLNSLIHREMQERGTVTEEEHKFRVLEPRQDLTGADRAWASRYEVDDVLRYSRGSNKLEISAGEYATVKAIDHERNLLTVQRDSGEELTYNPRELQGVSIYRETEREFAEGDRVQFTAPSKQFHVANRELGTVQETNENGQITVHTDSGRLLDFNIEDHPHLDYGYAVTSHGGQGQTTDRVLINVDTELGEKLVNERLAYVAVSRARYDAHIYTNDQAELARDLSREYSHSTATDGHSQGQDHEHGITHSAEHGHTEQSFRESGQSPAPDAAQGQSIGMGEE
jgi:conjugative relaxase-like TrwC/TraI family protein